MREDERTKRKVLQEAFEFFNTIVSPQDKTRAMEAWDDLASMKDGTNKGQKLLISEARAGNLNAINYLYLKLLPLITDAFWTYFLGPSPSARQKRIQRGDQYDFVFIVYQMLLASHLQTIPREEAAEEIRNNIIKAGRGVPTDEEVEAEVTRIRGSEISKENIINKLKDKLGRDPSEEEIDEELKSLTKKVKKVYAPLEFFNPEKFSDDTDLLPKVGYYVVGTIRNESIGYNARSSAEGIVGKISKEDRKNISHVSYENTFETGDPREAPEDHLRLEDAEAWESFVEDTELDSTKEPSLRTILKRFLKDEGNFDIAKVAKELNVSTVTVRSRLKSIAPVMERNNIDPDTFQRLIKNVGGSNLLASL